MTSETSTRNPDSAARTGAPDRPNVLLICTDQQFAGAMSCAGNEYLATPAMDQLAESGVRFSNAYCTNPICAPSRASLVTGRMPDEVGVPENGCGGIDASFRDQELGRLFRDAGYECAYAGKWHLPNVHAVEPGHGFERISRLDDPAVADACVKFLADERDRPFLLTAQFDNPHNICEWSRDQPLPWGSVPSAPPSDCPPLPDNYYPPPYEPVIIRKAMAGDWAMGAMDGATPDEWRQLRHAYYRLVEKVDAAIGRILDALADEGLAEETLVVFTSDHGEGHGSHQIIQKTWLYEEQVRVPFIVRPPGVTDAGRVDDRLISNGLDILPTLCDFASIDPPEDLPGWSVRPLVHGRSVDDWRDAVVAQTQRSEWRMEGRMVRTGRYKYVVYNRGRNREQLFDIKTDPGEMVDLSDSSAHQDVLDEHRELLLEHCRATGDMFAEWYEFGVPTIPGYEYDELVEYFDPESRDGQ